MEAEHHIAEGYELSPEQARVVQLGGTGALRTELRLRVPAETTLAGLEQALRAVAARHEILRTQLVSLPGIGVPIQRIEPETRLRPELRGTQLRLSFDAWMLDHAGALQLAAEWAAACAGELGSEPALQYADYAAWRNQQVADDAAAGTFWSRARVQWQSAARLPFRGLLAQPSPSFARAEFALPASAAASDLPALTAEHRVDPPDLIAALWLVLLARHAGATQLGFALDWQERPAFVGEALGAFFEPLPLMAELRADASVLQLARDLRERRLELLEHREYYPAARQPLAAGYGFRQLPDVATVLSRRGWSVEAIIQPIAWQPLTLECSGSALRIEYDAERYGEDAIVVLAEQLGSLLADFARDPHRQHAALSALSSRERASVRGFAEAAPLPEPAEAVYRSVAEAPSLWSVLRPEPSSSTAVASSSETLSYAELSVHVCALADRLRACGVVAGEAVGHRLQRGVDAVVGMLAILQAGAVYVPIDPSAPPERSADMLARAGARWIVTDPELRIAPLDPPPPAAGPLPDVAYVIFTSGSTGRPKGVPITQRAALHSLGARLAHYPGVVQRFLLVSPFAFDSSIAGLFATLAQGGTLFVATEEEARDPAALARIIERQRITHLLALPSLHQLLLAELAGGPCSLQTVIVAGEACPPELVALHAERLPNARLYNEYGPTEAAVWITVADLSAHDPRLPVPIGRPIPHARVRLLDAAGEPVPRGIAGELYVGGPGLSPGYLGAPELSAGSFVELDRERFYRTGDRGAWNEHGELVFAGRSDHQLKLRGQRIELAEIEAVLERVTGARAVVLADASAGEPQLRAFLEQAAPLDRDALTGALAAWLPAPMIPSEIEALPELPRTASGKPDRPALSARPRLQLRAPYAPPRGPLETLLAQQFAALLGVESVGRDDDFFALGGHSLLVVKLVHRLRAEHGLHVRVGSVFEHPQVSQLAAALAEPTSRGPVVLREGQGGVPLFCLHDSHGDVHGYTPALARLPAGKRVYGLPLTHVLESEQRSIASLARAHATRIRELCPAGPYELCGYSVGGVLAFEVAALLEREGERVRFLGLFDSTLDVGAERLDWPELARAVATELAPESAARFPQLPAAALEALRAETRSSGIVAQLRHALFTWAPAQALALRAQAELLVEHLDAMERARRWLAGHRPASVRADIDLFAAEVTLAEAPALPDVWRARTQGRVRLARVPGDHDTLRAAPQLAESLANALGRSAA